MGQVLLLFDIDGTLLRSASEAHAKALSVAMREVHLLGSFGEGSGALPTVEAAGRTDMEIAREIALLCDLPIKRFDELRGELMSVWLREYVNLVEGRPERQRGGGDGEPAR